MALLKNLGLFFVVFLPAVTLANMIVGVLLAGSETAPEWKLGWNPVLWLVVTAPWVVVAVAAVPVLHLLGVRALRRMSVRRARAVVMATSPALFLLVLVLVWGSSYFSVELGVPVCFAAILYGALLRMPGSAARP